ncbi:GNAT family N-acetyltransferase [Microbacterium sp. APC 3898]|uniref:GNAT family N-acetyltransferase n=2 Tax=Planococcus TaxID=1372 RepID=A0ABT7ZKA9_9BACL|nr:MULTISPECIES: GNAT family N-acetyltransferase [Terrabacteria group]MBF6632632.1 GNAT family N-acetyltransferase [Planococcus sp. (in: firmicutes)]MBD8014726.1 GNAT family N-acetyltransferase [Planococcus wigleyi]MDN3427597.1 GNAT family N-acetyltransferase [Planococcus sp. APC 4016]MDN3436952.1 GNAT family N-acetyltransferase [Planococcus sp. APC 3900]MDN3499148.1 GNAT family N-acetyltransferase [Microbacterium sp. APC 3898]
MNVIIRQARPEDAENVAPLIINAIGEIADHMTAQKEPGAVLEKVAEMVRGEHTRHSYHYTYTALVNGTIAGALVLYHGNQAEALDRYLIDQLKKQGHDRSIEPEAHLDEWYIDTVSVDPAYQGQGIGSKLFEFAEERVLAEGGGKLSLNVDIGKEGAIRLYKRLGYSITEPWTIIGEPFHHMVKTIS